MRKTILILFALFVVFSVASYAQIERRCMPGLGYRYNGSNTLCDNMNTSNLGINGAARSAGDQMSAGGWESPAGNKYSDNVQGAGGLVINISGAVANSYLRNATNTTGNGSIGFQMYFYTIGGSDYNIFRVHRRIPDNNMYVGTCQIGACGFSGKWFYSETGAAYAVCDLNVISAPANGKFYNVTWRWNDNNGVGDKNKATYYVQNESGTYACHTFSNAGTNSTDYVIWAEGTGSEIFSFTDFYISNTWDRPNYTAPSVTDISGILANSTNVTNQRGGWNSSTSVPFFTEDSTPSGNFGTNATAMISPCRVGNSTINYTQLANSSYVNATNTAGNYWSFTWIDALPAEKEHDFYANCGENQSTYISQLINVTYQPRNPNINFSTASPPNASTKEAYLIFGVNYTSNDSNPDTLTATLLNLSSGLILWTNTTASNGLTINLSYNLTPGNYSIFANVTDDYGNTNATERRTIYVANYAPGIAFVNPTPTTSSQIASGASFIANVTMNDTYINTTKVYLYNSSSSALLQTNTTSVGATNIAVTYTLSDGRYKYNATACDVWGLCNSTETREIAIGITASDINVSFHRNISQMRFIPNWTKAMQQINFTSSAAMQGNWSFNFSERNVSVLNLTEYLFNVTANSVNVVVRLKQNQSKADYEWWCSSNGTRWNISDSYTDLFNLSYGVSRQLNCTVDIFNASQVIVNKTLTSDRTNFDQFSYVWNVT